MAERQSRGPLQVITGSPEEINDALRQVREELDELQGLRGNTSIPDIVSETLVAKALRLVDASGQLIHAFGTKS